MTKRAGFRKVLGCVAQTACCRASGVPLIALASPSPWHIDFQTLLWLEALTALISLGILAPWRRNQSSPGSREAGLAMVCVAPADALIALRGILPDVVSIVLANLLIWVGTVLVYAAFGRFAAAETSDGAPRQLPMRRMWLALTLVAVLFVGLYAADATYSMRLIVTSSFIATQLGFAAWELVRDGGWHKEPARRIAVTMLATTATGLLVRIALHLPRYDVRSAAFDGAADQILGFLPAFFFVQGFGITLLLMQRERSEALAYQAAVTDALTGCLNRRAFEARVVGELADAARKGRSCALLVIDLDHFKTVNDTYGHSVGDQALRLTATVLRNGVRPSDVVARVGGEEFCVILRESDAQAAEVTAKRLGEGVRQAAIEAGGRRVQLTTSIGIAASQPGTPEHWETLFRRADEALYRAKHGGRDRVEIAG